jgi:hypothetical protein
VIGARQRVVWQEPFYVGHHHDTNEQHGSKKEGDQYLEMT